MSRITATRIISAPVEVVWSTFAAPGGLVSDVDALLEPGMRWRETRVDSAGTAVSEDLVVLAVEPLRSCTIGLADRDDTPRLTYLFTPIEVGAHRGETAVQAIMESDLPPDGERRRARRGIASRVLLAMASGFAARTTEGALRDDLDALAAACAAVQSPAA